MEKAFEITLNWLQNYGALLAIIVSWAAVLVTWYYKKKDFREKRFLRQVNVSLNMVNGGTLKLRTLAETTVDKVWQNEIAVDSLLAAAEKATKDFPFVSLENKEDQEWVKKSVLNFLSEKFSEHFIFEDMGAAVKSQNYIFAITCEKYGDVPSQKIRIMLIDEEKIKQFGSSTNDRKIRVEVPHHNNRVETLSKLCRLVDLSNKETLPYFGRISLTAKIN